MMPLLSIGHLFVQSQQDFVAPLVRVEVIYSYKVLKTPEERVIIKGHARPLTKWGRRLEVCKSIS